MNNETLPAKIKKILPIEGQNLFVEIYNNLQKKGATEGTAYTVAWRVVKPRFHQVGENWIARSEDFVLPELFVFKLEATGKELLMNDENGEIVLDAVLASTDKNTDGRYFEVEDLEYLAKQINERGSTLPDRQHETWKEIANTYVTAFLDDEELYEKFKQRKGVFRDIKAIVKEGKLWIRANLDKRYKNYKSRFSSLSVEAVGRNINNRIVKPFYLGFTFTDDPKVRNARIIQ